MALRDRHRRIEALELLGFTMADDRMAARIIRGELVGHALQEDMPEIGWNGDDGSDLHEPSGSQPVYLRSKLSSGLPADLGPANIFNRQFGVIVRFRGEADMGR